MTLLSKDPTDPTPASFSDESTEVLGRPSRQSPSLEKTPISTKITKPLSLSTLPGAPKDWKQWDQIVLAASLMRGALARLQKHGLIYLTPVWSRDGKRLLATQIEFRHPLWSDQLVLSDGDNTPDNTDNTSDNSQKAEP